MHLSVYEARAICGPGKVLCFRFVSDSVTWLNAAESENIIDWRQAGSKFAQDGLGRNVAHIWYYLKSHEGRFPFTIASLQKWKLLSNGIKLLACENDQDLA